MANIDAPCGFQPLRHLFGGTVRYEGGYTIASGYASSIFSGDLVTLASSQDGKNIEVATAGSSRLVGVFFGCRYTAADGSVVWDNQWRAGTVTLGAQKAEAFVYTDPGIVYVAQSDDGSLDADDVGAYVDFVSTHAGNSATGISGQEIDGSSALSTLQQLKIVGIATAPDGITPTDVSEANSRWEVIIAMGHLTGDHVAPAA